MQVVYSKKCYKIYRASGNDYIVHNTRKEFKNGHTHIRNYSTAKYVLDLSLHSSIPKKHISSYLLESIIRLSTDKPYIKTIQKMKDQYQ